MKLYALSLFWLSLNAYHEARGEPIGGQIAVCHVVMNRVANRGKSIQEVIIESDQFSWTIGIDPLKKPINNPEAFLGCMVSAAICLGQRSLGNIYKGADHYFNPNIVRPKWARSMVFIARNGNHDFYRDDKRRPKYL